MARRLQRYNSEASMHEQLAQYIRMQYPNVLFHTDFAAGIKMTMGQAVKNKRLQSGRAWPDLFIAKRQGAYGGLFLELKKEGTRILLKNGKFTKDAHAQEQLEVLEQLAEQHFACRMVAGFGQAKFVVDQYMRHGSVPTYEGIQFFTDKNAKQDDLPF